MGIMIIINSTSGDDDHLGMMIMIPTPSTLDTDHMGIMIIINSCRVSRVLVLCACIEVTKRGAHVRRQPKRKM